MQQMEHILFLEIGTEDEEVSYSWDGWTGSEEVFRYEGSKGIILNFSVAMSAPFTLP